MKTASKVFIWLSIVGVALFEIFLFIYSLSAMINSNTNVIASSIVIMLFLMLLVAVPIVVGIISLKKLSTATDKNQLTGIAIITLLFCSFLAGIFMLCMRNEDLQR